MKHPLRAAVAALLFSFSGFVCSSARAAKIPSPSEALGFEVGADKKLADYRQIATCFRTLAAASPRVRIEVLGKTTLGEDMFMAVISSEENLANRKRIQEISRKLADPRGLTEAETDALAKEGRVVLLITCNIHSSEIGASQMAMEWAYAELPPEYAGGLEKEGAKALVEFVENGETLVALAKSSEWVMEEFNIPVRNSLARVREEDFGLPGSILRVHVSPHPVTCGLPADAAVLGDEAIAFQTAAPGAEMERWVLATYPRDPRDILLSGWIRGEDRLTRRAAAVAMTYGKGKLVLLGFRAPHRAQTLGTYSFLFNALYWSVSK